LAQSDTFNAQDPSSITASTQLDAAIQLPYEPGSVNKVVAFSARCGTDSSTRGPSSRCQTS
jgi:hypothetical protein